MHVRDTNDCKLFFLFSARHVLCIVPINTLQNWVSEFNHWLPEASRSELVRPRGFKIHVINESLKNLEMRSKAILGWRREGGVLLMGYELYRQLANKKTRKKKKRKNEPEYIDIEEEDKTKSILDGQLKTFLTGDFRLLA